MLAYYKSKPHELSGVVYEHLSEYLHFPKRSGSRYLDYDIAPQVPDLKLYQGFNFDDAPKRRMYVSYRDPRSFHNSEINAKLKSIWDFDSLGRQFPREFSPNQHDRLLHFIQKFSLSALLQHENVILGNQYKYQHYDISDHGWPGMVFCFMIAGGWDVEPIPLANINTFLADRFTDVIIPDHKKYTSHEAHFLTGTADTIPDVQEVIDKLFVSNSLNFDTINDYLSVYDVIADFFSDISESEYEVSEKTFRARQVIDKFISQPNFIKLSISDFDLIRRLHKSFLS